MKRFFSVVFVAILAAFAFNSCETMDPEKDFTGTIYGFWIVDKLEVEASLTVNGETINNTSTTDFTKEYCRLLLDTSNIATGWYNLKMDIETFSYDENTKKLTFKEGLDIGDNGKAIVFLGVYDVELNGDQMILRQPKASIGGSTLGASESATYTLHRAPKTETPKEQ